MSLTIKAATAMHFAGAAYAAGDTIDTTGMDDRSIAVLLKHQPVYVASAASSASEPLTVKMWQNGSFLDNMLVTLDPAAAAADGLNRQVILPVLPVGIGDICGVDLINGGTVDVVVSGLTLVVFNAAGTEGAGANATAVTVPAGQTVSVDFGSGFYSLAGTRLSWNGTDLAIATDEAGNFGALLAVRVDPNP